MLDNVSDVIVANRKAYSLIDDIKVINHVFEDIGINDLYDELDTIIAGRTKKARSTVLVLASVYRGEELFLISISDDLSSGDLSASDVAKRVAGSIGGDGVGSPSVARGSAPRTSLLYYALRRVPTIVDGLFHD